MMRISSVNPVLHHPDKIREGDDFRLGRRRGKEKGGLGKRGWVMLEWPLQVGLNTMAGEA